jgi:UDP-N-acetyl-D-glucosamine dehydrogenase
MDADGPAPALLRQIHGRSATIGVIGLGYVGLPLVNLALASGYRVLGFDIDAARVDTINRGESAIAHIPMAHVAEARAARRFQATADFSRLDQADALLICVPTPLTRQREPDLRFVRQTAHSIAATLRKGQLIVLESTTYPGTTAELMRPILEEGGLRSGTDFFLAYSPEREDPGSARFGTASIPKVVSGDGALALRLAQALYASLVERVVPVSSLAVAEAVKLTENIFRSVNIALVNELKVIYAAMGIDVWEVIEAAKTKPFGYMPFYPGPGLGGHCVPIDPFYLTWKAREFDVPTRFIELAGEINQRMPYHVIDRLAAALDARQGRGLRGARVLVLGLAYKKNIEDTRESPALKLMELIEARGGTADYHDPFVPVLPHTRAHGRLAGRGSVPLTEATLRAYDAALIATDHDGVDYALVASAARLVVDTRNALGSRGITGGAVVKA